MDRKNGCLSGNALKIIAALAMLCDHVGLMFFPHVRLFRIIGRLAFPIFAYMIAEAAGIPGAAPDISCRSSCWRSAVRWSISWWTGACI